MNVCPLIKVNVKNGSWEKGNPNLKQILVSIDSSHHEKNKYLTPTTGNTPFRSYTPSKLPLNYYGICQKHDSHKCKLGFPMILV